MEQKTTWMRYLIFGISLIISLTSCDNEESSDCLAISDFIFINNTSHTIETPIGIINPNSSLTKHEEGIGPCNISASNFVPPFLGTTKIIFDSNLCLIYQSEAAGVGEGPVGINNYFSLKVSDVHYKFTYEFTESDFNQAEDCN